MPFKKSLLVGLVLLGSLSLNSYAQTEILDPMHIESTNTASSSLLQRVIDEKDEAKRYEGIAGFIKNYGEWITLEGNGINPKIHISSYLIQSGQSELAAAAIKNDLFEGWLPYRFLDGVASDFVFALQEGHLDYLQALFKYSPKGLNTPLPMQLGGEKILPLSLLATREYMDKPFYDDILMSMLEAGANPHKKMSTGLSPMLIASSTNNMKFIRIVQVYQSEQMKDLDGLMKNTPIEESEMIEMQAIADTLIEQTKEKKAAYDYDKLHSMWIQMILKGYNVPADLMYEELKTRPQFNINTHSKGGLTPLMAATMSPLYGGNVEYAERLINRGADPLELIVIPGTGKGKGADDIIVNYIQLALQRDNFKIVALMISKNVNFITSPQDEEVLLLSEAMNQKAFVSASILKQALMQTVNYSESKDK